MSIILAIDDDKVFLESLVDFLEVNNFPAIDAENGILGLKLAKEKKPDLIICNIKMPGFNGYEVLKAVRQEPMTKKIPFIFLTAEHSNSARRIALDLGANDYLDKLSTVRDLIKAITTQL
jgi:DNA-binding response OmpR family regulator